MALLSKLSSKKRETRKSLSQPGWITLEGGFAARQCVVQDLSTTGAKVTIDDPNSLPAKSAAGVFARRQDRTPLRGGLAPRQIGRHQVRPLIWHRPARSDKRRDAKISPGHDGRGGVAFDCRC